MIPNYVSICYSQKSTHIRVNTVCGLQRPLAVAVENIMPRYQMFICWLITPVKQVTQRKYWTNLINIHVLLLLFFTISVLTILLQFTKLKTPNKDEPSNTLPKVMEDEEQVEVVGLSFISGWTFQTLKRGLHTVAHNGDRNLLSLDGVAVNPIQYKHVLKIVFFSSSQK